MVNTFCFADVVMFFFLFLIGYGSHTFEKLRLWTISSKRDILCHAFENGCVGNLEF